MTGFTIMDAILRWRSKLLLCDVPACSFIKNFKPCYIYGCRKFEIKGDYVVNIPGKRGRVTYPRIDAMMRTDDSFRDQEQSPPSCRIISFGNITYRYDRNILYWSYASSSHESNAEIAFYFGSCQKNYESKTVVANDEGSFRHSCANKKIHKCGVSKENMKTWWTFTV